MIQKPTILVHASGFIQGDDAAINLGDMAQQLRAIHLLRKLFPEHRVITLANSMKEHPLPPSQGFIKNLPAYLGKNRPETVNRLLLPIKVLWLLVNAFLLRIFGGTLACHPEARKALEGIRDSTFVFYAGAGPLNQRYLRGVAALWLLTATLTRILGTPLVLIGQQIGPLKLNILNKLLFRVAFGRALFVGCRDKESVALCHTLGLRQSIVHFTGDEGGYDAPADWCKGRVVLNQLGLRPGFVAVQIRLDANSPFDTWMAWWAEVVNRVSQLLDVPVLLVPMAYRGAHDDRHALNQLRGLLSCHSMMLECEDPALTKAILAHASVALGVANHFVVFSASVGVPCLGIYATDYMRQKLEGAQRCFPHVTAQRVGLSDPEQIAELAVRMARSPADCESSVSFDPKLPDGYWVWLDRLAERGIVAQRNPFQSVQETP